MSYSKFKFPDSDHFFRLNSLKSGGGNTVLWPFLKFHFLNCNKLYCIIHTIRQPESTKAYDFQVCPPFCS